jgi:hypothetical protein
MHHAKFIILIIYLCASALCAKREIIVRHTKQIKQSMYRQWRVGPWSFS